jgi:hypothetical protein
VTVPWLNATADIAKTRNAAKENFRIFDMYGTP